MSANSQNRWKSAFLTLPDAAFFDLLRNYLGDIKSPFNKHSLLENLETFLRRPETRRNILALIDERDAGLLTAVRLLDSPTHEELYAFFDGEIGYLDLHHHLLNLQDRLLLYADRNGGKEEILLNPLLEEDLANGLLDPLRLIKRQAVSVDSLPEPWLGDSLLTALLAFLLEEGDIFKADGGLKKKAELELAKRFPVLSEGSGPVSRSEALVSALKSAGLLRRGENGRDLDLQVWKDFAGLEEKARLCLLVSCSRESDIFKAWTEAEFLYGFLAALEADSAYDKDSLVRLGRLLVHEAKLAGPMIRPSWIDDLEIFGALFRKEDRYVANPKFFPKSAETDGGPRLIVQPNFDLLGKPGLRLEDGIVLAAAADLIQYDRFPRYELTKESYSRAMALGFHGEEIVRAFKVLTEDKVPQNVSFCLEIWEREYGSLALYEGIVIVVDEDRRHLIEHHEELQRVLRLRLAPGVYLTDRSSLPACREILKAAGIDMVPRVVKSEELQRGRLERNRVEKNGPPERQKSLFDPSAESPPPDPVLRGSVLFPRGFKPAAVKKRKGFEASSGEEGRRLQDLPPAETVLEGLAKSLEESELPDDQKRELKDKIRRRLVLLPEQLRPDSGRKEKSEAKGLDYVGKVLVIEQTLKNPSNYLEIILRTADGSPERILARPRELKKTGADLILLAASIPGEKPLEIAVRKISLVRRLRGFLMG